MTERIEERRKRAEARVETALRDAGPSAYVVGYDANGIQSFITSTNRQALMRAASSLIRRFDDEFVPEIVQARQATRLFASGGRGRLLAENQAMAEDLIRALKKTYRDTTHGESLAAVCLPYEDNKGDFVKKLDRHLQIDKDETDPPAFYGYPEPECETCVSRPGLPKTRNHTPDGTMFCERCYDLFKNRIDKDEEKLKSLDQLGNNGLIAVIAADGNKIGQLFFKKDRLSQQAGLSEVIKGTFKTAKERAEEASKSANLKDKDKRDILISLITGGDDVRAIMDPRVLPIYISTFARVFHQEGSPELKANGFAVGALLAHPHFPSYKLFELATQLEDTAKRNGKSRKFTSAVNFHSMSSSSELNFGARRIGETFDLAGTGENSWAFEVEAAQALAKVPSAQRAWMRTIARSAETERDDEAPPNDGPKTPAIETEAMNAFLERVARSNDWQQYVDFVADSWTERTQVRKAFPTRARMDLADTMVKGDEA